jgi:hypothetical protein
MVYESLAEEAVFLAAACIAIFGVYTFGVLLLIVGIRAVDRRPRRRRRRF